MGYDHPERNHATLDPDVFISRMQEECDKLPSNGDRDPKDLSIMAMYNLAAVSSGADARDEVEGKLKVTFPHGKDTTRKQMGSKPAGPAKSGPHKGTGFDPAPNEEEVTVSCLSCEPVLTNGVLQMIGLSCEPVLTSVVLQMMIEFVRNKDNWELHPDMAGVLAEELAAYYADHADLQAQEDLEAMVFVENPSRTNGFKATGRTKERMHFEVAMFDRQVIVKDGIQPGACAFALVSVYVTGCVVQVRFCFGVCRCNRLRRADSLLGMHLKLNGPLHTGMKKLLFPAPVAVVGGVVPDRIARFTSPAWVAHIFASGVQKHFKQVNSHALQKKKVPSLVDCMCSVNRFCRCSCQHRTSTRRKRRPGESKRRVPPC